MGFAGMRDSSRNSQKQRTGGLSRFTDQGKDSSPQNPHLLRGLCVVTGLVLKQHLGERFVDTELSVTRRLGSLCRRLLGLRRDADSNRSGRIHLRLASHRSKSLISFCWASMILLAIVRIFASFPLCSSIWAMSIAP